MAQVAGWHGVQHGPDLAQRVASRQVGDTQLWPATSIIRDGAKLGVQANDKWYGQTKKGEYRSEADAKAAGNHPDHGKACS